MCAYQQVQIVRLDKINAIILLKKHREPYSLILIPRAIVRACNSIKFEIR